MYTSLKMELGHVTEYQLPVKSGTKAELAPSLVTVPSGVNKLVFSVPQRYGKKFKDSGKKINGTGAK